MWVRSPQPAVEFNKSKIDRSEKVQAFKRLAELGTDGAGGAELR